MSTLYIESVAEQGNCLHKLSYCVRRELKVLGITEILLGIVQITLGLPLNFDQTHIFVILIGVPWWSGIWYIVSGSLVVDIINTSNTSLKQVVALTHVVSCLAATIGFGAYLVSLYLMPPVSLNFFYLQPLLLLVFLTVVCLVELVVASLILFLHCVLIGKEIHISRLSLSRH
ncbi:membrane-spanning 4-domains, subfamily A, member 17A.17 [Mobula hypostoma]|uniref:membrane-spanning 4-domains, subfamily A, member 17A.17 n=1 Tax=Mobula hypostoma TaxID=723540 RepID=UPI002FC31EC9